VVTLEPHEFGSDHVGLRRCIGKLEAPGVSQNGHIEGHGNLLIERNVQKAEQVEDDLSHCCCCAIHVIQMAIHGVAGMVIHVDNGISMTRYLKSLREPAQVCAFHHEGTIEVFLRGRALNRIDKGEKPVDERNWFMTEENHVLPCLLQAPL